MPGQGNKIITILEFNITVELLDVTIVIRESKGETPILSREKKFPGPASRMTQITHRHIGKHTREWHLRQNYPDGHFQSLDWAYIKILASSFYGEGLST